MNLTEFLLARIAEDEADARGLVILEHTGYKPHPANRVADGVLRLLALPYAAHEAYRDEWRP